MVIALVAAIAGWHKAFKRDVEVGNLQGQLEAMREAAASAEARAQKYQAEEQQKKEQMEQMVRLVDELRAQQREAEKLREQNQKLKMDNDHLRDAAAAYKPAAASSQTAASDQLSRENWKFAGYATPEAALVSSIWSMKEGNPKTYLDSLAPEEQARMAKIWENKSEAEVAAKHQQDVSAITGMRILDRKPVSADEVQMSVYIQGVDRMEKVSMKLIDNQWKFAGFIRDPKK
jgi:myosin heavy subunit